MLKKIKNWILKILSKIGFSINIPEETKDFDFERSLNMYPNVKKSIYVLTSCVNTMQQQAALNFARLAIKKDIYHKDRNMLLFERENMFQNLVDLSDVMLDKLDQSNKLDQINI